MKGELLEAGLVHSIVAAFLDVYNYFGYGLCERAYSRALDRELRDRGHGVAREAVLDVRYKGHVVARQRLDMVVDNRVIVENKATERIAAADRAQLLSYLKTSSYTVGVLLHFGPAPRFERYIDYPKRISAA